MLLFKFIVASLISFSPSIAEITAAPSAPASIISFMFEAFCQLLEAFWEWLHTQQDQGQEVHYAFFAEILTSMAASSCSLVKVPTLI